jgi:hypothetical protein
MKYAWALLRSVVNCRNMIYDETQHKEFGK